VPGKTARNFTVGSSHEFIPQYPLCRLRRLIADERLVHAIMSYPSLRSTLRAARSGARRPVRCMRSSRPPQHLPSPSSARQVVEAQDLAEVRGTWGITQHRVAWRTSYTLYYVETVKNLRDDASIPLAGGIPLSRALLTRRT